MFICSLRRVTKKASARRCSRWAAITCNTSNYRYRRTGTLWEGRYKSTLLDTEQYLMTCYRYIELNPVRANIARKPGDYPWSSYHYNGSGECDSLVVPHPLYMRLGTTKEARLEAYQGLIRLRISGHELDSIREATNRAWLLGDEKFKNQIEALLDRQGFPLPRGGDRKSENYREKQRINRV